MSVSNEALVLWIELLGYRRWLQRQKDLERAEKELLSAIEMMYKSPDGTSTRLHNYGIRATLISDTIIVWTSNWHIDTWIALHFAYHVLATELAQIGLPVRGALALGSFRVRDEEPRTLLGDAVIYCASLERTIKAFMVAVDDSVVERLQTVDVTLSMKFRTTLTLLSVPTSAGPKRLYVMNWMIPTVPHALHTAYRRLYARYAEGDKEAILDLMMFLPKFLNSRHMIRTLILGDQYREQAEREWEDSISHAERNWDFIFERGRQELEKMKAKT